MRKRKTSRVQNNYTHRHWTDDDLTMLHANYERLGPSGCMALLNRSHSSIVQKAVKVGLYFYRRQRGVPPRRLYIAALQVAADANGVGMDAALGCSRKKNLVRARWQAWTTLYEMGKFSTTGIGFVAGYDHTTILSGMRRLREQRPAP